MLRLPIRLVPDSMKSIQLLSAAFALSLACLASCVTEGDPMHPTRAAAGPWLEPSPMLAQEIEQQAERLPWTHGYERIEMIHWFASVGEPAYPTLLGMVSDPRMDVAGSALAALGATGDSRLVEPLRGIPWPLESEIDLALERARTLLRLGDWSMVPHLIDGLEDDRVMIRALSAQALYEATHQRFDYDPSAAVAERETAVDAWRAWWTKRQGDPLVKQ